VGSKTLLSQILKVTANSGILSVKWLLLWKLLTDIICANIEETEWGGKFHFELIHRLVTSAPDHVVFEVSVIMWVYYKNGKKLQSSKNCYFAKFVHKHILL